MWIENNWTKRLEHTKFLPLIFHCRSKHQKSWFKTVKLTSINEWHSDNVRWCDQLTLLEGMCFSVGAAGPSKPLHLYTFVTQIFHQARRLSNRCATVCFQNCVRSSCSLGSVEDMHLISFSHKLRQSPIRSVWCIAMSNGSICVILLFPVVLWRVYCAADVRLAFSDALHTSRFKRSAPSWKNSAESAYMTEL